MLDWIQDDAIPERGMNAGGFWSNVLVSDKNWSIILEQIQDDAILERAMSRDWSKFWLVITIGRQRQYLHALRICVYGLAWFSVSRLQSKHKG